MQKVALALNLESSISIHNNTKWIGTYSLKKVYGILIPVFAAIGNPKDSALVYEKHKISLHNKIIVFMSYIAEDGVSLWVTE